MMQVVSHLRTSTAMYLVKGAFFFFTKRQLAQPLPRILEYLSRDDAERAVRDLDGKDLRGKVVRVEFDENVVGSLQFFDLRD